MTSSRPRAQLAEAPEAAVVVLAAAGDDSAFAELVARHQGRIRPLLRRLAGDPTAADDLAQQVFVTAWQRLRDLRSPGAFEGWIRRIAVTTWLQEVRRRGVFLEESLEAGELVADDRQSLGGAPERMDLERGLSRLSPPQRLCVVLAYAEGMTHIEIVEATGLPLGTVKSHLTRGAARLRALLALEDRDGR
jgi:RNA polymerase sigma-70 factor, ECF subfamily